MTGVQAQFRLQGRVRDGDNRWDTLANALSLIGSADPAAVQDVLVDVLRGWERDIENGAFLEALAGRTYSVSEPVAASMPKINADIEGHAIKLILDAITTAVVDDDTPVGSEADLPNIQQRDQAHELALQVARWIRDHPDDLVRRARGYAASTIRYNQPEGQQQ